LTEFSVFGRGNFAASIDYLQLDDVEIEFAPEFLGAVSTRHMMVHFAGGLRLEFIAVGAPARAAGGE
jgi:hypothetical protein